jgi:hypothetical protein
MVCGAVCGWVWAVAGACSARVSKEAVAAKRARARSIMEIDLTRIMVNRP